MAHKTLIGGTAYEIGGGRTLVNGTGYSIDKGKTLVGGTAYEVGFDDGMRTVNLSVVSTSNSSRCYIQHNGAKYYDATQTPSFEVNIGDTIYCYAGGGTLNNEISLNNRQVAYNKNGAAEYHHTVVSDVMILLECDSTYYSDIYIAEIPEGKIAFAVGDKFYFADEGMTWGEFVDSEYNTVFEVNDNMIRHIEEGLDVCLRSNFTFPSPNDLIIANAYYYLTKD